MGSRAGIPNRNKTYLLKRLQDMYGEDFHPIMKMAENAVHLHNMATDEPDVNNLKAALDGWDKIAQYTEPKLKAMEVTGEDGGAIKITKVELVPLNDQSPD